MLDAGTRTLQDTNDAYLANIQRNGTYSVVPRIPGGEITPEKLIVIGEVARDFGLYTKITGGQRIDLFGARVEQLPAIWRRLVDAGFESGHAYGKSLRTVKSCVGSTWCRYGVQDSVGLAIKLELRYRGLRSPHKLKGGVSGCARECAEARPKDFGVIATEQGWNLYVGGNGGATPAHARLLAGDLDTETLVRYLDRFLMYYIRTADRLQRTAPWVDSLDGGLDRVREVVVDDALGLGSELEAAMARHVGGYFDEWAGTLEDPDKLARFVSFVNAPGLPTRISFRAERDQAVPADPDAARWSSAPTIDRWTGPARPHRRTPASAGSTTSRSRWGSWRWSRARQSQSSGPTTETSTQSPTTTLVPRRRCCRAGSSGRGATSRSWHRRCTSRRSTCGPDSASTTRPSGSRYDVAGHRRPGPGRWSPGGAVDDPPTARRLPDRRDRGPASRGAGRPARAAWRPGGVGAGPVGRPQPGRRRGRCGAATADVVARPVDLFLATTGIGMKTWFAAAASGGESSMSCWRRSAAEILARGPKSVGALRRRGLRECGRRSRSASRTSSPTCAGAT